MPIKALYSLADIDILYEDEYLIVIDKPAGMPCVKDLSGNPDCLSCLSTRFPRIKPVHRLDTGTGGVMVFGIQDGATARLSAEVTQHDVFVKRYLCLLPSPPPLSEGRLEHDIFHDRRINKGFAVAAKDKKRAGVKHASLSYRVLSVNPTSGITAVGVTLHTGRTHQIRVQFSAIGLPLLGDGKYGSTIKAPFPALWSYSLGFPHPMYANTDGSASVTIQRSSLPDIQTFPWNTFGEQVYESF